MADQCIVCLENLDSAIPLPQLQGPNGSDTLPTAAGAVTPGPAPTTPNNVNSLPLAAAAASAAAAAAALSPTNSPTATTNITTKEQTVPEDFHLENDDNVAVIQVCGHVLHDSCLKAWTGKANSCPICRQAFHVVEVYDKIGGE